MQKVLGYMRKAVQEFNMISEGDRVAVGVSGGKDSLVLLEGLYRLSKFIGINYEVVGITIDPQFNGEKGHYEEVEKLCENLGIEYHIVPTQIGEIVFDAMKAENPCSICARMRRGALCQAAEDFKCNKLALGHHFDDSVETFLMNLLNEGRIGCFSPVTVLSDKITLIRPLVLSPEKAIKRAAGKNQLPVVKSKCPADGKTNRQKTKEFIRNLDKEYKGAAERIFGAMRRADIDGWGGKSYGKGD